MMVIRVLSESSDNLSQGVGTINDLNVIILERSQQIGSPLKFMPVAIW